MGRYKINKIKKAKNINYGELISMRLFKINDFYTAGLIMGVLAGIAHNFVLYLLILTGIETRTYWKDMAEVFLNPPQVFTFWGQLYGLIASLGMSGMSGVIIALLIRFTGRDYLYIKTVSASIGTGLFVFMVIYPSLGLNFLQHSLNTQYVAFFSFMFYGLVIGYLFDKFTAFND